MKELNAELEELRMALEILADPRSYQSAPGAIPVKVSAIAQCALNARYRILSLEAS